MGKRWSKSCGAGPYLHAKGIDGDRDGASLGQPGRQLWEVEGQRQWAPGPCSVGLAPPCPSLTLLILAQLH